MSKKPIKKILAIVYDILFFAIIIAMLGSAFIFFVSDKEDKSFYGYRIYEVLTNSMKKTEPSQKGNFVAGDMIVVKIKKADEIKVGDIITFVPNQQSTDTFLTHRVKRIEEGKLDSSNQDGAKKKNNRVFVTQGDANNIEDPPTKAENVIGVVSFSIPNAGNIVKFIKKSPVACAIFVIAFLLMITLIKNYFVNEEEKKGNLIMAEKTSRKKKRKKRNKSGGENTNHQKNHSRKRRTKSTSTSI